jgi:hypothetical protein
MKKAIIFLACILISGSSVLAQFGISTDSSNPDNSAMLDVKSSDKGALIPRMTITQRDAIVNPANGLMVFCTNCGTYGSLSVYSKISESTGIWRTFSPCNNTAPSAGTHVATSTSITWNWNSVPDAVGYKWGTTNDYSSATDMGTGTSKNETNLTCGTLYTRYLWAYNSCGVSSSVILTESTLGTVNSPNAGTPEPTCISILWNWSSASGADGYKWSMTNDYATATEMGTATSKLETGLTYNNTYNRYVWAYNNSCGVSPSTTLTGSTTPAPSTPAAGTHTSTFTTIVWNWGVVSGATGYKWGTTNSYTNATDMGTSTTKTESSLTCGTPYTRYVWAYNACGPCISPVVLTQSTDACFVCGTSITIVHSTTNGHGVAPVDKTVTYGTITNVPGETTKCWITKNLGADQQAGSATDATELSAGWYWQFDRKQGYKHDGTTRTPSGTWNATTGGTNNWLNANDPCIIELGNNWRVPTNSEWINVDAGGGWDNYTEAWDSPLKLHAAGYLDATGGTLQSRGVYGLYSSSTYNNASLANILRILSGSAGTATTSKATGCSVRCIRNP